jgi:hypothetical protein
MTGPPGNKWAGPALPSRLPTGACGPELHAPRAIGARKNLFAYAKTNGILSHAPTFHPGQTSRATRRDPTTADKARNTQTPKCPSTRVALLPSKRQKPKLRITC